MIKKSELRDESHETAANKRRHRSQMAVASSNVKTTPSGPNCQGAAFAQQKMQAWVDRHRI
jgi:hypothetical protein